MKQYDITQRKHRLYATTLISIGYIKIFKHNFFFKKQQLFKCYLNNIKLVDSQTPLPHPSMPMKINLFSLNLLQNCFQTLLSCITLLHLD